MRKEVHNRRRPALAVAAFVMALALPVAVPLMRDGGEAAASAAITEESGALRAAPAPRFGRRALRPATEAAHSGSMMLVGTLLFGIGSIVRRAH